MGEGFWALCGATFVTVFVAELGDKTQLAALGLASAGRSPWAVFLGSAAALVLASALAVGLGKLLAERVDPRWLHYAGAALFLLLGAVMLARGPEAPEAPEAPPAATQEAQPGE